MNAIEPTSPGTKAQFFLGFLDRGRPLFAADDDAAACGPARRAASPPPAASARSAGRARRSWASAWVGDRGAASDDRELAAGARRRGVAGRALRRGRAPMTAAVRRRGSACCCRPARPDLPRAPAGGRDVPHPRRHPGARRADRATGGLALRDLGGAWCSMAFRPRFADFVLKMPRGAQVVYPKDLGPILTYADIYPGARVLEAGTGLGRAHDRPVPRRRPRGPGRVATSCATSIGSKASRTSRRSSARCPTRLDSAAATIWARSRRRGSTSTGPSSTCPSRGDRSRRSRAVLEPGGVLCAYLPTTVQVQELVLALPTRTASSTSRRSRPSSAVARHRAERTSRPPHGRSHGIPHDRTPRGVTRSHLRVWCCRRDPRRRWP